MKKLSNCDPKKIVILKIYHQNSLTMDVYDTFYTISYYLNKDLQSKLFKDKENKMKESENNKEEELQNDWLIKGGQLNEK